MFNWNNEDSFFEHMNYVILNKTSKKNYNFSKIPSSQMIFLHRLLIKFFTHINLDRKRIKMRTPNQPKQDVFHMYQVFQKDSEK